MTKVLGVGVAIVLFVIVLLGAAVAGLAHAVFGGSTPSTTADADIPAEYLALYQQAAATCPGLDWTLLAAIGKIETDHGRSQLPGVHSGSNSAGAEGPMQFEPPTFARYDQPVPLGGAEPPSPYDPADAIYAAARMLCANGATRGDLTGAILSYNHSETYVQQVLDQAATYAQSATGQATCAPQVSGAVSGAVAAVINFACAHLGTPYVWGGNGTPGFDCSGLTHAAYAAAGLQLPRTAQAQYDAGPPVPAGPLRPGDLVYFGASTHAVTHVGLVLSGTTMIDAPHTGATVRIDRIGRYLAATRPVDRAG